MEQAGNSTLFKGVLCDKIDLKNNEYWREEVEKMEAEFKIE